MVKALDIHNLGKNFGKLEAVKGVTIKVETGEIYTLIGPNGAGKTTLVKTLTGLIPPTTGEVEILGLNVWTQPVPAKRLLGYIPDEPWVYPYFSAREFLELTGDLHGLARHETEKRIKELSRLYQIETLLDGNFSDFSRGNKQKTVIVAALIHQPKVLVIDEPIVGLDTQSQHITKDLLLKFAHEGGAVFLCTHTLSIAEAIADRIGILHHGRLVAEGTLKEIKHQANIKQGGLEAVYLQLTK